MKFLGIWLVYTVFSISLAYMVSHVRLDVRRPARASRVQTTVMGVRG